MGKPKDPTAEATLDGGQASHDVGRAHDREGPRHFIAHIPEVGGEVAVYLLQAEQVVAIRDRLIAEEIRAAGQVKLPAESHPRYSARRHLLVKLLQACTRRPPPHRPQLACPGDAGYARLAKMTDVALVALCQQVVKFNLLFG